MIQTLGTALFPASALGQKPEESALNVTEANLIVIDQILFHVQQSLGTISEVWVYLAQLKIPDLLLGLRLTGMHPFYRSRLPSI